MADKFNSNLERTNLEVHVDMERQRFAILSEKVEKLDEQMDERFEAIIEELANFRKEHAENIKQLREENSSNAQNTQKIYVGGAATVIAGLLSTIVVLLIAFI